MKILHIIYSFTTGGAETMLVDIANEQIKEAEVHIIVINRHYEKSLLAKVNKQIKVHLLNRKIGSKNPFPILKLNFLLIKIKADVLHCHNDKIIPLILSSTKRNVILTLHYIGVSSVFLHKYRKLFAISKAVQSDIIQRTGLQACLIYNGIHSNLIKTKNTFTTSENLKIIVVGRLDHEVKGQHLVIEALNKINNNSVLQVDFIGVGPSLEYLKELTNKFSLTQKINFLGLKDRSYIYNNLKKYDLLIQPSIKEGFGLTIIEAMAAKIPVLVSDIKAPMEVIANGKYGYYFNTGNSRSLANRIKYINDIINSSKSIQMTEMAYKHTINKFDVKEIAKKYIENYRKL